MEVRIYLSIKGIVLSFNIRYFFERYSGVFDSMGKALFFCNHFEHSLNSFCKLVDLPHRFNFKEKINDDDDLFHKIIDEKNFRKLMSRLYDEKYVSSGNIIEAFSFLNEREFLALLEKAKNSRNSICHNSLGMLDETIYSDKWNNEHYQKFRGHVNNVVVGWFQLELISTPGSEDRYSLATCGFVSRYMHWFDQSKIDLTNPVLNKWLEQDKKLREEIFSDNGI